MKEIQINNNNKNINNNDIDNDLDTDSDKNQDVTNDMSIVNKVKIFYKKNEKELLLLLGLLIVFNFICPSRSIFSTHQIGGSAEGAAAEEIEKNTRKIWSRAYDSFTGKKVEIPKGPNTITSTITGKLGKGLDTVKKTNVFQSAIGLLFGLVKSLITFGGLILVLAIMPGLPIFIFMLILFFILRARVAALKSF